MEYHYLTHCKGCGRFISKNKKHGCPVYVIDAGKPVIRRQTLSYLQIKGREEVDIAKQSHYTRFRIQPITFIEANHLSYSQGNVVKYVCRFDGKNGVEDLRKAKVYLDYLIQIAETGDVKP